MTVNELNLICTEHVSRLQKQILKMKEVANITAAMMIDGPNVCMTEEESKVLHVDKHSEYGNYLGAALMPDNSLEEQLMFMAQALSAQRKELDKLN